MLKTTLQTIDNAFNSASKDESKFHLMGIFVRHLEGPNFEIVATNGHILSIQKVTDDNLLDLFNMADLLEKTVWIGPEDKPKIKIALKTKLPAYLAEAESGKITLTSYGIILEKTDLTPPYTHIIPKEENNTVRVSLNPMLLTNLANALKSEEFKKDGVILHIDPENPKAFILVRTSDPSKMGVLAPMKL